MAITDQIHRVANAKLVTARRLCFGGALLLSLGLAACNSKPAAVDIGLVQPLSGPLAALGTDMKRGAELAIKEINATGGVSIGGDSVQLRLLARDDKSDPKVGVSAANELVSQGIVASIANLNSGVSIESAPIYAKAGVPQLAISTNPRYTQLGLSTTLRLVASDALQAQAIGVFAAQLPGVKRVALLDDSTPYGKSLAEGAGKAVEALKVQITSRTSVDDKTTEFKGLIEKLKQSTADVLITTLSDFQVDALLDQLVGAGLGEMVVIGGDTIKTPRLAKAPKRVRALYASSPINEPKEFPGGNEFVERFKAQYHADVAYAAHYAYDAVFQIADAMSRNRSTDKAALLQTLKSFDGNCPATNAIRFNANGEQRYGSIGIYQIHKGAWESIMRSDKW